MKDRSPVEGVDEETTTTTPRKGGGFRRWLAGGMLGLTLGAVLLGGTAFAQTDTNVTDTDTSFLDRLAGKLGMTTDELQTTIEETRVEAIDDAIAQGGMTEEQGLALKERVQSGDGRFQMMPGRLGLGQRSLGMLDSFGVLDIDLGTIASELQMTPEELQAELDSAATLSEVITAQGSTVDAVVTALVADAETKLAEAVANGDLTQDQTDQMLANLPERLTQMIERGLPGDCNRWFNGGSEDNEDSGGANETSSQV